MRLDYLLSSIIENVAEEATVVRDCVGEAERAIGRHNKIVVLLGVGVICSQDHLNMLEDHKRRGYNGTQEAHVAPAVVGDNIHETDAAWNEGATSRAQGFNCCKRAHRLGANKCIERYGIVGIRVSLEKRPPVITDHAQVAATCPGKRHSVIEIEPAPRDANDGRVNLNHIRPHARMLGGNKLGKREASSADGQNAMSLGANLEDSIKGAVVRKDRLHAAVAEIRRALIDATRPQHAHPISRVVAHRINERKAGGRTDHVWVERHNQACGRRSRGGARECNRPRTTKLLADHTPSSRGTHDSQPARMWLREGAMSLRFIISPAKKMRVIDAPPWPVREPRFLDRTERLMQAVQALSREEAKALWACSDRLANLNFERFASMELSGSTTAAVISYEGIQYTHMAPEVMSEQQLSWLDEHLRILSGFYGVLRPLDGVVPYRLEMQAKLALDGARDLYGFWGSSLYESLAAEGCDLIINAASVEYARAVTPWVRPDGPQVLACLFGTLHDGRLRQAATEAKAARGTFIRWCAEHKVEQPGELTAFDERGYLFCEELSNECTFVFARN